MGHPNLLFQLYSFLHTFPKCLPQISRHKLTAKFLRNILKRKCWPLILSTVLENVLSLLVFFSCNLPCCRRTLRKATKFNLSMYFSAQLFSNFDFLKHSYNFIQRKNNLLQFIPPFIGRQAVGRIFSTTLQVSPSLKHTKISRGWKSRKVTKSLFPFHSNICTISLDQALYAICANYKRPQ